MRQRVPHAGLGGVGRRGAGMFAWLPSKLLQRRVPRELGDTINSNQVNDLCRISTATTQQCVTAPWQQRALRGSASH